MRDFDRRSDYDSVNHRGTITGLLLKSILGILSSFKAIVSLFGAIVLSLAHIVLRDGLSRPPNFTIEGG
jgi:hypothetical protein